MRTNRIVLLLLIGALLSGTGCTSLVDCFRYRYPSAPREHSVIMSRIIDADTGEALLLQEEVFDEDRQRVTGVSFEPVYFAFDSARLAPAEVVKIEQVGRHLMQNSEQVVVVEGHCDERGSNEYNLSLGEQRASAIRTYLIDLGVAGDRVQTVSFGEEKPASQGHGENHWRLNRRGEFVFYR